MKSTVVAGVLLSLLPFLPGTSQDPGLRKQIQFQEEQDQIRLSNGIVELVLDRRNGYFRQIRNLRMGTQHKPLQDGVWPFGLWLGTREQPEQKVVEVTATSPQQMSYRFNETKGTGVLTIAYPDLVENATRESTGIRLDVKITLPESADHFLITAHLKNGERYAITNFYAAKGTQLTGDSTRDREKLTTAFWGTNSWKDLKRVARGSLYTAAGWYDYQGSRAGIGMGYVNRQGLMLLFETSPRQEGISQGWRLFNLKGYWHFENLFPPEQQDHITPLEPGGELETDEWIIAPHEGDWHRMADIYRQHYNAAFRGDYISYRQSPAVAKECDLVLATWLAVRKVYMRPEEFVSKVEAALRRLKEEPRRIGLIIHQGGTSWGKDGPLYCPDFFPLALPFTRKYMLGTVMHLLDL